jgi:anaerobic magnesium-protoporphyrin IX monomethyl ester cyclase
MKICLINPAPFDSVEGEETFFHSSAPPLGLMYLAGYLQGSGHQISILDQAALNYSNERVVGWIKKKDPDLVGFSVICSSFENAKKISKKIKIWNPNLKIVFGNYLATFYSKKILEQYDYIDFCVRGEGEITFENLVNTLNQNKGVDSVRGLTYRTNGIIKNTPDRNLIKDLDSLPFPDRALIPDFYRNRIGKINISNRKFTTIISSRGCPYSCNFCGCSAFYKGIWRPRSVDNILQEIIELSNQGYRELLFVDDNFIFNKKKVMELCQKLRRENLDIAIICDGRVNNCSIDLLKAMKKANFEILMMGIESASQRILNYYNKPITPEMSRNAVKNARKAGFKFVIGTFMIGALDETYSEAISTMKFMSKLDIDFPYIIFTRALPGTNLFKTLVRDGIIAEDDFWETGVDIIDLPQAIMKREIIYKIIKEQFHVKFFRPSYLIKAALRTILSKYRREIISNHLNFRDMDTFFKLINNPPDLF